MPLADKPRWFPSRLLEIGDDSIRLVEVLNKTPTSPYVTLSHCWGKAQFLTLKQSNLDQFTKSIPASSLPRTFQDAVAIAKRLKIYYIWIDSLCIIQDLKNDWLKEASLMHKIYANAYCNIAATGARDSSYGLFIERDIRQLHPVTIDLQWRPSDITSFEEVNWMTWNSYLTLH